MDKILSVVIPTYNMEKYLRRCLDSLIIQDKTLFEALEVIVVNDGSKDLSSAIAHEYQDKYPNVFRVIDKENGNYGSCVNKGVEIASGIYFRILDADDWFDNAQLAFFLEKLQTLESEVVLTSYSYHINQKKVKPIIVKLEKHDVVHEMINCDFSDKKFRDMLVMHAITYKTQLLRDIGYWQQTGISYTDIEYCYFPFSRAKRIVSIDVNLYQYCLGREGQTMQRSNIIRSISHFEKVATRIVGDYIRRTDIIESLRIALVYMMSNPIYHIYLINLIFVKHPTESQIEVMNRIEQLAKNDVTLYNFIRSYTYRKLPFVRLWQQFGFRLGVLLGN